MITLAPWNEQWQHFTSEIREQSWGDLTQHTQQRWQVLLGRLSVEAWDRYLGVREYERSPDRADARNGFCAQDFVTCLDTLRVRVVRTRQRVLWRKLRMTNVIERCFVEGRRRTRQMVCFVTVQSMSGLFSSSSIGLTRNGTSAPSPIYTSSMTIPLESRVAVITL